MRILGITIPEKKRLEIGLTAIYGIGRPMAHKILSAVQVNYGSKPKDLSSEEENKIRLYIENSDFKVEGDLKREKAINIKNLKDIRAYRGIRHERNLPVRGQNTKTNSRTVRGNTRKTMGSGKRKAEKT